MLSDKDLVSIIMPAYNCENYIEVAINSIICQTYTNWELLICDDASTDKSHELILKYAEKENRIKVFRNDRNLGQVLTRNFLISQSVGNFIAMQDADDWSLNDRIEKQHKEFCISPDLGVCGTWAQYFDESGNKPTHKKKGAVSDSEIRYGIEKKNQFCGASIMVRKEVLSKTGLYRDYFIRIGNEDYDLASRIVQNFKSLNIPEYLYCVRQSIKSSSRNISSAHQLISADIVSLLINQRKYGKDFLELNDLEAIKKIEENLLIPYKRDSSLIRRRSADIYWYNGDCQNYFISSFLALRSNPYKIINWKYFISACYRVFIFQFN